MIADIIRQRLEERESSLSHFAIRSRDTRGRRVVEEPLPLSTEFQRDLDSILHTNAFRRLKHKTQVFIAPEGDHFVTRLTHTLEVAQIARTISRALNLNEDLTEAIALGHDLGHTPFGHLGEEVLDILYPGGFRHNLQSLRVVDYLEGGGQGLNLTKEVRQGIVAHSKPRGSVLGGDGLNSLTLEAQVCRLADAVAYINHDLADAFRAGVITEDDLPKEAVTVLGSGHPQRINIMVSDIVESSWPASGEVPIDEGSRPSITMSAKIRRAVDILRGFLFQRVYLPASQGEEGHIAREVISLLYHHYCRHPRDMTLTYVSGWETTERSVVDHIAGMTDQYATRMAENIRPGIAKNLRFRLI
ncbi:MAG: deoxyguanosinetriphosphate triphosphohydrolase [Chloroflexi bacterium]|nr:deoxyguanosinetriphosphate triphosphohydrolase [Chloroflexota bacterium]